MIGFDLSRLETLTMPEDVDRHSARDQQDYYSAVAKCLQAIWGENLHVGIFESPTDTQDEASRRTHRVAGELSRVGPQHRVSRSLAGSAAGFASARASERRPLYLQQRSFAGKSVEGRLWVEGLNRSRGRKRGVRQAGAMD